MFEQAHPFGVGPAQHIDHVADAETLADPVHARQGFLRIHGGVELLRRVLADIAVAAVLVQVVGKIIQQHAAPTGDRLGQRDHGVELVGLDALLVFVLRIFDQASRGDHVLRAVQQQGLGRQAVAPGAPGLLVIALDVFGQVVVHHEAHIRLVDTHAEGNGGHHHLQIIA